MSDDDEWTTDYEDDGSPWRVYQQPVQEYTLFPTIMEVENGPFGHFQEPNFPLGGSI